MTARIDLSNFHEDVRNADDSHYIPYVFQQAGWAINQAFTESGFFEQAQMAEIGALRSGHFHRSMPTSAFTGHAFTRSDVDNAMKYIAPFGNTAPYTGPPRMKTFSDYRSATSVRYPTTHSNAAQWTDRLQHTAYKDVLDYLWMKTFEFGDDTPVATHVFPRATDLVKAGTVVAYMVGNEFPKSLKGKRAVESMRRLMTWHRHQLSTAATLASYTAPSDDRKHLHQIATDREWAYYPVGIDRDNIELSPSVDELTVKDAPFGQYVTISEQVRRRHH